MVTIGEVHGPADLQHVRALFREYADSIGIDLAFQGFDAELAALPGAYASPRGCLRLAFEAEAVVGCVAVRPLEADVCEMKRLYVAPRARGGGVGLLLARSAVSFARGAGYHAMRLDTLKTMEAARAVYRAVGFREVGAYCYNPIADAVFMELDLGGLRDVGDHSATRGGGAISE